MILEKLLALIKEAELLHAMLVADNNYLDDDMISIVQDLIWLHRDLVKYE